MSKTQDQLDVLRKARNQGATAFAVVLAIVLAYVSFTASKTAEGKAWAAAIWAVAPPTWFWIEYAFMTSEEERANKDFRDRLKYAQDVASKIWLAIGSLFTASYIDALVRGM